MPPRYAQYLERLRVFLPDFAVATGLAPQILLRPTHGHIVGNIAFALMHVLTPYILKTEHDVEFVAPLRALSVVRDIQREPSIKFVRFNHRATTFDACDRGYYGDPRRNAQIFFSNVTAPHLENAYTRSVCFSDMAHLTTAAFYRDLILTARVTDAHADTPCLGPEGYIQPLVALDHNKYGTHVLGMRGTAASVYHHDAKGERTGLVNHRASQREVNAARSLPLVQVYLVVRG